MEDIKGGNTENLAIRDLLDRYLASQRTLKSSIGETSAHLDEDSLSAFVEGTLSRRESAPVLGHLVDCGFCRHKTAELVRLDLAFAEAPEALTKLESAEPSRISTVLSDLLARIFGTSEGAVFAHHEETDEEKKSTDEESEDKDEK